MIGRGVRSLIQLRPWSLQNVTQKHYAALPKRFYKKTGVLGSDGKFEIFLDQKKLKTPKGSLFTVDSEPLALAISTEWNSQKETIDRSGMHLTALSSTVIDNPANLDKLSITNYLMNYAITDTVLFHCKEEAGLYEMQKAEWNPIIDWFNEKYSTNLKATDSITPPEISTDVKMNISKYLKSYNLASLHGFIFAVDTLKSIILAFACVDRFITPEKAVLLSRLEEEYQLGHWGRVEWAHDLTQQELQGRLAAAIFFVHCNSFNQLSKHKMSI